MRSAQKTLSIIALFSLLLPTNCPIASGATGRTVPFSLSITEDSFALPDAKVGVEYEYLFQSEGGLAPLTWRVQQGQIPPGLKLETSGQLHGIPTQATRDGYAFILEVADSSKIPQVATMPMLLMVQAAPLRIIAGPAKLKIVPPGQTENRTAAVAPVQPSLTAPIARPAPTPSPTPTTLEASLRPMLRTTEIRGNNTVPGIAPEVSSTSKVNVNAPPQSDPPCPGPECSKGNLLFCGRLRPASMDQTLSLLQSLPSLRSYIDAWQSRQEADKAQNDHASNAPQLASIAAGTESRANSWALVYGGEDRQYLAQLWDTVANKSKFTDAVTCRTASVTSGVQKEAVVDLLHWLLINRMLKKSDPNREQARVEELKQALGDDYYKLSADIVRRQISLLNEYIGNVKVVVKDKDGEIVGNTLTDADGNFSIKFSESNPPTDPFSVFTEADNEFSTRNMQFFADCNCYKLNIPIEDRPASFLSRVVLGFQQAGAAATETQSNYFFDFFVSKTLPTRQKISPDFGEPWRIWGSIRAISVPQSGDFTLAQGGQTIITQIPELKANEAARVFDGIGGIEYRLSGNSSMLPSFDRQTKQKFSLSFIAGLGFVTPQAPSENIPVYEIPANVSTNPKLQKVVDDLGIPKGQKYIAFPRDDRDRFFRQYYAGFRVQTFFFNQNNIPLQRFPAQFDLTIGQNEYVTGGHLRGPVVRFDGYFPLPYDKLQYISLFGTAVTKWARVKETTPLVLIPKQGLSFTDSSVYLIPSAQFDRDYYRVGVGFDFVSFIKKYRESKLK